MKGHAPGSGVLLQHFSTYYTTSGEHEVWNRTSIFLLSPPAHPLFFLGARQLVYLFSPPFLLGNKKGLKGILGKSQMRKWPNIDFFRLSSFSLPPILRRPTRCDNPNCLFSRILLCPFCLTPFSRFLFKSKNSRCLLCGKTAVAATITNFALSFPFF